ncbi:molybdopterin-guanine dinucleotide biosynthesis protein MobA [Lacihabitans sp. LS3-19]|uniref:NTP transferase domain-containing protein n=1 Tax=Lacihabitans sp. LS3-19 TaxID=2487335 RepID=UPI0020CC5C15|nr:NTP transferase domain-containing protein [Lacihabitans sp. LS3-19]MCP9766295.1 molybdopterin-guanine dinucleotide biosynthesis protein MobA [Lacihabitans sp. LS3-19]
MKKHEKHSKLSKPDIGFFGRNEFSFLGAPCGFIEEISQRIISILLQDLKITYIDADHGKNENDSFSANVFQDKISHIRLEKKNINEYEQKFFLNDQDLILVNGNHFQAKSQFVIIDPKKEASLKKRNPQLTDVKAYILAEGVEEIYPWLNNEVEIPIIKTSEIDKICAIILSEIKSAPLKALILTGGKSSRMGEDKSEINYHGVPQHQYLSQIFEELGVPSFISCRAEQELNYKTSVITDKFSNLGPYGAILSAFQSDPNAAWLVIACDLPLIKKEDILSLISTRNARKFATAILNPATNFPDPLFTIWEPKAYLNLLSFLSLGYSCPRKVLINSDIELVEISNPEILSNVNTPEDRENIKNRYF